MSFLDESFEAVPLDLLHDEALMAEVEAATATVTAAMVHQAVGGFGECNALFAPALDLPWLIEAPAPAPAPVAAATASYEPTPVCEPLLPMCFAPVAMAAAAATATATTPSPTSRRRKRAIATKVASASASVAVAPGSPVSLAAASPSDSQLVLPASMRSPNAKKSKPLLSIEEGEEALDDHDSDSAATTAPYMATATTTTPLMPQLSGTLVALQQIDAETRAQMHATLLGMARMLGALDSGAIATAAPLPGEELQRQASLMALMLGQPMPATASVAAATATVPAPAARAKMSDQQRLRLTQLFMTEMARRGEDFFAAPQLSGTPFAQFAAEVEMPEAQVRTFFLQRRQRAKARRNKQQLQQQQQLMLQRAAAATAATAAVPLSDLSSPLTLGCSSSSGNSPAPASPMLLTAAQPLVVAAPPALFILPVPGTAAAAAAAAQQQAHGDMAFAPVSVTLAAPNSLARCSTQPPLSVAASMSDAGASVMSLSASASQAVWSSSSPLTVASSPYQHSTMVVPTTPASSAASLSASGDVCDYAVASPLDLSPELH